MKDRDSPAGRSVALESAVRSRQRFHTLTAVGVLEAGHEFGMPGDSTVKNYYRNVGRALNLRMRYDHQVVSKFKRPSSKETKYA